MTSLHNQLILVTNTLLVLAETSSERSRRDALIENRRRLMVHRGILDVLRQRATV